MDYYERFIKPAAIKIGLANLTRENLCAGIDIHPRSIEKLTGKSFPYWLRKLQADGVPAGTLDAQRARISSPHVRQELLLDAGLKLARADGLAGITAKAVAASVGVSRTLVQKYLCAEGSLKAAIVAHAITRGDATVLADGLRLGVPVTGAIDPPLYDQARALVLNQL